MYRGLNWLSPSSRVNFDDDSIPIIERDYKAVEVLIRRAAREGVITRRESVSCRRYLVSALSSETEDEYFSNSDLIHKMLTEKLRSKLPDNSHANGSATKDSS